MSFTFGASAIESLRIWPEYKEPVEGEEIVYDPTWQVAPFEWIWFFESMLPAVVLLLIAAVGIYLFITERNQASSLPLAKKSKSKVAVKKSTNAKKRLPTKAASSKTKAPRKRK
jgi:hypothetical protein